MREIKFRSFLKSNGEMLYDFTQLSNNVNTDEELRVLMQYTGLKDKNGTEIYEGDILSTDLSRPYLIVEFRNGAFMLQCQDSGKSYYDYFGTYGENLEFVEYHEVIGNIYEHPQLI